MLHAEDQEIGLGTRLGVGYHTFIDSITQSMAIKLIGCIKLMGWIIGNIHLYVCVWALKVSS